MCEEGVARERSRSRNEHLRNEQRKKRVTRGRNDPREGRDIEGRAAQ